MIATSPSPMMYVPVPLNVNLLGLFGDDAADARRDPITAPVFDVDVVDVRDRHPTSVADSGDVAGRRTQIRRDLATAVDVHVGGRSSMRASGEHNINTASAMSSGVPMRRSGIVFATACMPASSP